MVKVLALHGLSNSGIKILEQNGFEVLTTKVAQNQIENYINKNSIDALLVDGTTQVRQELLDACPSIKLIGTTEIDSDSIDIEYAVDKGIHIIHTPTATSNSVAELVFAHLFGMARFLHQSNREMPLEGDLRFKELKKSFSNGVELRGKTLGIIGLGCVGKEVAKLAIGLGMNILIHDLKINQATIQLEFFNSQSISFDFETVSLKDVLKESDFITLHIPKQDQYLIGEEEINLMKKGVGVINTANGSIIDEVALVNAIETKKVKFAGLDVFENQPNPEIQLLMNPEISLTPNIGGLTLESQERKDIELANKIVELLS